MNESYAASRMVVNHTPNDLRKKTKKKENLSWIV